MTENYIGHRWMLRGITAELAIASDGPLPSEVYPHIATIVQAMEELRTGLLLSLPDESGGN
jgi:hypothetical protein